MLVLNVGVGAALCCVQAEMHSCLELPGRRGGLVISVPINAGPTPLRSLAFLPLSAQLHWFDDFMVDARESLGSLMALLSSVMHICARRACRATSTPRRRRTRLRK